MDVLEDIARVLIEKEKINGVELLQLIYAKNPELVPKSAMDKAEKFVELTKGKPPADMAPPTLAPAV